MLLDARPAARRLHDDHRPHDRRGARATCPTEPRADQDVIRPWSNPMYAQGHLAILRGNLAPEGCVAKITGLKNPSITGPARVFDSETAVMDAIMAEKIKAGDVIVIRYEGPKGGPGHAGDAGADVGADRAGPRRIGRAHHRRPLLRRHVGHGRRPRRAGGVRRRHDRAGRGRRFDHDRRAPAADPAQRRRRRARARAARAWQPPPPRYTRGLLAQVHAPRVDGEQGRDHRRRTA